MAFDLQHGVFLGREFLDNFLSPAQDRQAGRQAAPIAADQYPALVAIETPALPSPRNQSPPSRGAEGLCSRLLCGDSAFPRRRRKADRMHFSLNCLLDNGLGMNTRKTNVKTEGDSWDLISFVAVTIYLGKRLWACGWLSEKLLSLWCMHACMPVCLEVGQTFQTLPYNLLA